MAAQSNFCGGGSGACFACVAQLAFVGVGGVLGIVLLRRNRQQCWSIAGGSSALGHWWLHVGGAFAGWHWGGHISGAVLLGQWRCYGVGPHVLVLDGEGPDNQHEVEGGRWKVEGGRGGRGEESLTKERGKVVVVRGGHSFLSTINFLDKIIKLSICISGINLWWYQSGMGDQMGTLLESSVGESTCVRH